MLFARYRAIGDLGARDELVRRHLPLARSLARRYAAAREPLEDLEQVASLALLKAVERYSPDRATAFSSFAVPTIAGELRRHLRDHERSVRVPRGLHERIGRVTRAAGQLGGELGRSPTAAEIGARLGLAPEDVAEALAAQLSAQALSLDAPHADGAGEEPLHEAVGADEGGYSRAEERALLAPALRELPAPERLVVHLRFSEDLTQSQIAARIGVSQVHVSRLLRRALDRLRAASGSPA